MPVSQRGCVGRLNPQLVEVWTLGRPIHPQYFHIVEAVCGNRGSVGASLRGWSQVSGCGGVGSPLAAEFYSDTSLLG